MELARSAIFIWHWFKDGEHERGWEPGVGMGGSRAARKKEIALIFTAKRAQRGKKWAVMELARSAFFFGHWFEEGEHERGWEPGVGMGGSRAARKKKSPWF